MIFQMHLQILPKLPLIFLLLSAENTKNLARFYILVTITLGVNMIARQTILLFSSALLTLSVGIFYFRISRLSNSIPWDHSPYIMFWSVEYTFASQ